MVSTLLWRGTPAVITYDPGKRMELYRFTFPQANDQPTVLKAEEELYKMGQVVSHVLLATLKAS
jgi:hypothetical protein